MQMLYVLEKMDIYVEGVASRQADSALSVLCENPRNRSGTEKNAHREGWVQLGSLTSSHRVRGDAMGLDEGGRESDGRETGDNRRSSDRRWDGDEGPRGCSQSD